MCGALGMRQLWTAWSFNEKNCLKRKTTKFDDVTKSAYPPMIVTEPINSFSFNWKLFHNIIQLQWNAEVVEKSWIQNLVL